MATHSSILAWRISWTDEPGRLESMGSQESEPDLPVSVQESLAETWVSSGLLRGQGH